MGKASRKKQRSIKKKGAGLSVESAPFGIYATAFSFILIAVTALLIYSNTFSSPFHFDDIPNIVENSKLRDLFNFWPPSGTRYVGLLSFALNYHFGGLDVFGYHLVNIIIHIINGLLVWSLIVLTFKTPVMERTSVNPQLKYFLALTVSLIFITHPVQTQAVTYIVQRFSSLAALFYLLSIVLYIRARLAPVVVGQGFSLAKGRGSGVKTILLGLGSLLSAVLAMKTKEISFTLPFVILLYEFMFFEGKILTRKNLFYLIPFLLTILVIPLSLIGIDKPIGDVIGELREAAQETEEIPRWVYLLTQFRVIVTYIRLLFIPINQNMDYDYPLYNTFFEPWVFFSFIFLLSIFAFAVYLFIRSRKTDNVYGLLASFGILWFFITLSVESSIIPIRDVIFEHRLYLPGVGAAVAFSSAAFYVFGLLEAKLSPLVAACVLIVVISLPLGVAANQRNYVWGDAVTFWQDIVKKSPLKARGHNNLGEAYNERGQMDNGIEELEIALRLKPGYADAHTNLGIAYGKKGLLDKAEAELLEALKLLPNLAVARNNLGIVYARKGRLNRAIEEYKTALGLKPDFAEAHNNLGNVYYKEGRMDEAIEEYNEALRLTPSYAEAHNNLGNVYYKQGRMDEAIEEYNEALRLESDLIETHFNLGLAYKRKGLNKEALKEFEKVLEISPDNEKARKMLQSISR